MYLIGSRYWEHNVEVCCCGRVELMLVVPQFSHPMSGTLGTVYHGKWRGTDVAIKQIKDSCCMGKPSEPTTHVSVEFIGVSLIHCMRGDK